MSIAIFIVQVMVQFAWGVVCFLYSPHNIVLSILNVSLVFLAITKNYVGDDHVSALRYIYLATWVVPLVIVAFSYVAGLHEMQEMALRRVGLPGTESPIDGSSETYAQVLKNYAVSQLLPLFFGALRWLSGCIWRE